MPIQLVETDADLHLVWPIMQQLRDHIPDTDAFIEQVHRMQETDGYQIAFRTDDDGKVVAAAGFRPMEMLFRGKFLYVDDLITDSAKRSEGHGKAMLDWLKEHARSLGLGQVVLDSGLWREDAHRFYEREGMAKIAFNFQISVN